MSLLEIVRIKLVGNLEFLNVESFVFRKVEIAKILKPESMKIAVFENESWE